MKNELLQAGCELLADNKDLIHKNFTWDYDMMSAVGGMIFTGAGKVADVARMKQCKSILKKQEGLFSNFRGNMEIPVISKMALAEDPDTYLRELLTVYGKLHEGKLFGSEYMALTALCICDGNGAGRVDEIAGKTKMLIKRMKEVHPFLTSDEDLAFTALLAMTPKTVDQIIEETEICYQTMKNQFAFHSNAVQSLSHVMTLGEGSPEEKCGKVIQIYNALANRGIKYGKEYELASLGALVNLEIDADQLADEIAEASEYLKTRKGFGAWGMGSKPRQMFAALLVSYAHSGENAAMDASVLGGSLSLVIAEEVAIMAAITAAAAASNAANSSQ